MSRLAREASGSGSTEPGPSCNSTTEPDAWRRRYGSGGGRAGSPSGRRPSGSPATGPARSCASREERAPCAASRSVGGAFDVLLAAGSVWTTSYDTAAIAEWEPSRARLVRVFKDGAQPAGLARCGNRIWVGHGGSATWLSAIDPETSSITRVEVGAANPGWPRCIRGVLWVTASDTLLKVNGATGEVQARLHLGGTLAEAAEGPDALIWVTDKERSVVHRVWGGQPSLTDTFDAGPGAYSIARAGDAMWVTSFAGADVRRYVR